MKMAMSGRDAATTRTRVGEPARERYRIASTERFLGQRGASWAHRECTLESVHCPFVVDPLYVDRRIIDGGVDGIAV